MTCPDCKGQGQKYLHLNPGGWKWVKCWRCSGSREVSEEIMAQVEAGHRLSKALKEAGRYPSESVEMSSAVMGRIPVDQIEQMIREVGCSS